MKKVIMFSSLCFCSDILFINDVNDAVGDTTGDDQRTRG